jgi:hypothetical protein
MLNCPIGFSDPVYAEAYVKVHQFDILLGTSTPAYFYRVTLILLLCLRRRLDCQPNQRHNAKSLHRIRDSWRSQTC